MDALLSLCSNFFWVLLILTRTRVLQHLAKAFWFFVVIAMLDLLSLVLPSVC
jgi:hypothetical protein